MVILYIQLKVFVYSAQRVQETITNLRKGKVCKNDVIDTYLQVRES